MPRHLCRIAIELQQSKGASLARFPTATPKRALPRVGHPLRAGLFLAAHSLALFGGARGTIVAHEDRDLQRQRRQWPASVLLRWLEETSPDVVCLQELKSETFPQSAVHAAGYEAIWQGQKSWNGVAILTRGKALVETRRALPGDDDDLHSRYIEAAVDGLLIGCLYVPNGNPVKSEKFGFKLRWFERLIAHAAKLLATGTPVVLAGDYNVMPTELDVYKPERWVDDALFRVEVREALRRLVAQGWTDALRTLHPGERIYTFWKYFRNAFARDAGLRIDHFSSAPVAETPRRRRRRPRGPRLREGASDHAPVWIELADRGEVRKRIRAPPRR